MLRNLERLRASYYRPRDTTSDSSGGAVRDRGMADNLTYLAREIYGDRKVIVWAHNFHVRHDNSATAMRQRGMGEFVRERFRDELYTIGLYMNEGTAAYNDRSIYAIRPAPAGSMEWVLASTGLRTLFIDLLHQTHTTGNEWMFQPTTQREWGTRSFSMVPRNQYDGVVFIESVSAPAYIPL
jgi:erythromycin esterase